MISILVFDPALNVRQYTFYALKNLHTYLPRLLNIWKGELMQYNTSTPQTRVSKINAANVRHSDTTQMSRLKAFQ